MLGRWRGCGGEQAVPARCQWPLVQPGSLLLFGNCTICLNVFRVGYDVSHIHCKSQLELLFPALEIIFTGLQVTGPPAPRPPAHPLPRPPGTLPAQAARTSQPMPGNSLPGKSLRGLEYVHTPRPP